MTEMTVEAAEQEAREAEALVSELRQRVRKGDDDVTPGALRDAKDLVEFLKDRVHAAHRKADERRKTAAQEHAEEFKARLVDEAAAKDAAVVEAWTALVDALRHLQVAADTRAAVLDEKLHERAEVSARLRDEAGIDLADLGILPGRYNFSGNGPRGFQVPDKGIDVRQVQPHEYVAEALARGLSASTLQQVTKTEASTDQSTRVTSVVGWPDAVRKADESRATR